ncbi:MAG TPA: S9 family peptidase, partial [Vicinamibacteria bacterium]|nr:S9 family peptidase [Vicinamibacteria bacterium]
MAALPALLCRRTAASLLAAALAAPAAPAIAAGRPITETDLFRFTWVADPQISPDGRRVAFVRVTVNEKKDGYDTAIWAVDAEGGRAARPLTSGPQDLSPRWSPDGRRLAFTRAVEKAGKLQPPQLYVMTMDGGEARALTEVPKGASSPTWSPDGRMLAFTSTANPRDLERAGKKGGEADERESDVRVVTRAVYRNNGRGFLDSTRPAHVWTTEVPETGDKATPRQVTSGEFEETSPAFAPDGRTLFFVSNRVKEPYYLTPDSDVFSIPVGGGEMTVAASIDGTISEFALSADGKRLAFQGTPRGEPVRSYDQPELYVTDVGSKAAPRLLTGAYDGDVGSGLTGDQRAPRGSLSAGPIWSRDGRSIFVRAADHGHANLQRVDAASGKIEALTTGDQEIVAYDATPDGGRLAFVVSTPTEVGDLYVLDAAAVTAPRRLTRVNETLFSELQIGTPEEIVYPSFDGKSIQAWILKPPGFDPGKRYPLILNIHGGPHAAYGATFDHEFQWMAAKGYVVLYPNPRGSTSYGQDFGNVIQYRYPGDDAKDLLAGVDVLVKRGLVDDKQLGVTGGSGGGVLTNWIITQTSRFAAAVSQRSISDWAGFWYTADFSLFRPTWFKGAPWEDPADYAARSPITFVKNITTPLMLIEGEADLRTPPAEGGEQLFRALKYLKRPVVMVRFPEESHELSRSGKPWHRVERLRHIVGWFDKYLLGK